MRKPGATIGPSQIPTSSVIQALLEDLTCDELERVAAAVIREHRSRLQTAQGLSDLADCDLVVEAIVEHDDALMERYLNGEEIPVADLKKTLRKAVVDVNLPRPRDKARNSAEMARLTEHIWSLIRDEAAQAITEESH